MKKYNVGIVGIGAVGSEMVRILRQRNFPIDELRVLARRERDEEIAGEVLHVTPADAPHAFKGLDFALFAGTEGAKGASQTYGWAAAEQGVICIDNGDDFRMDDRVPLIVPEVNAAALEGHQNLIANPNCSTIIALMALGPLYKEKKIKRIIASTYQSVSGSGQAAVDELSAQARAWAAGESIQADVYPHQIAFNTLPHIGGLKDELPGYYSEELKMRNEMRKILGDADIQVCCTCVRVPTFYSHAESINVEFEDDLSPDEAREILNAAAGVTVADDPANAVYPMPIDGEGKDDVLVGRIRRDETAPNSLAMFVVGDNIRKGAALNTVQIAEAMI